MVEEDDKEKDDDGPNPSKKKIDEKGRTDEEEKVQNSIVNVFTAPRFTSTPSTQDKVIKKFKYL